MHRLLAAIERWVNRLGAVVASAAKIVVVVLLVILAVPAVGRLVEDWQRGVIRLKPFEVAKSLEKSGFNGHVLAERFRKKMTDIEDTVWSIAPDSCANHQAPWRTHKPLILLGFRCPVVLGRRPEGPLERTFHLLLRAPGASRVGGRRSLVRALRVSVLNRWPESTLVAWPPGRLDSDGSGVGGP